MRLRAFDILMVLGALHLGTPNAWAQFRPSGRQRHPSAGASSAASSGSAERAPTGAATPVDRSRATTGAATPVDRSRAPSGNDADRARLLARSLEQPWSPLLVERIIEEYRGDPPGLSQFEQRLERESTHPSPHAARAALMLHALCERRDARAHCDSLRARLENEFARDPEALEYLADRALSKGDATLGQQRLEAALEAASNPHRKVHLLQRLRNAALDAKDLTRAAILQQRLAPISRDRGSSTLEFGREALARCGYRMAIAALQPFEGSRRNDNAASVPFWLDVADAALLADDLTTAKTALERAWRGAGRATASSGLRQTATEIYRRSEGLDVLARRLGQQLAPSAALDSWLAELNEERGQFEQALRYRQRAITRRPNDLELHLAHLRAREASGDLEQAHRERQAIVQRFPDCVDQALLLADTWQRRGDLDRAERVLASIDSKPRWSPELVHRVSDAWERLGKHERAQATLARHGIPTSTSRLSTASLSLPPVSPEAAGSVASDLQQADAALSHGNVTGTLAILDRLRVAPKVTRNTLERVAALLERAAATDPKQSSYLRDQAEALWVTLLSQEPLPPAEQATAVEHVVRLWALRGTLSEQTARLRQRFTENPSDRQLGLWLTEALVRLGDDRSVDWVLATLIAQDPEDDRVVEKVIAWSAKRGDFGRALSLIERQLRRQSLPNARLLEQMVELAQRAQHNEQAVGYAERWVAAAPTDPSAWIKLGRLLRRAGASCRERAYQALLTAHRLSPQQWEILLELASWRAEDGPRELALGHLVTILRRATEEAVLLDAGRRAIALGVETDRLEQVELALLSAASHAPALPTLRESLLEIYAVEIRRARAALADADPGKRLAATERLRRVGPRAGAALVPILTGRNEAHQKTALDLLFEVHPIGIGHELTAFAAGSSRVDLRARALLIAADLADPALLGDFSSILQQRDLLTEATPVSRAAAFAVARIRTQEATRVLRSLLLRASPDLRAMAALWLAERGDASVVGELETRVRDGSMPESTRAAAWLALARLGKAAASHGDSGLPRRVQLAHLAMLRRPQDDQALADLLIAEVAGDLELAVRIASCWVGAPPAAWRDVLERSETVTNVEQTLVELSQCRAAPAQQFELFSRLAEALGRSIQRRIASEPETARPIGRWLLARAPELWLFPLVPAKSSLSTADQSRFDALLRRTLEPAAMAFAPLLEHPNPELRRLGLGVRVLVQCDEQALLAGLGDRVVEIRQSALGWAPRCPSEAALARIAELSVSDPSYVVRLAAVSSLGQSAHPALPRLGIDALSRAARHDAFSLVRMAALRELWRNNPLAARDDLSYAETHDSEPDVVSLAHRLRENQP